MTPVPEPALVRSNPPEPGMTRRTLPTMLTRLSVALATVPFLFSCGSSDSAGSDDDGTAIEQAVDKCTEEDSSASDDPDTDLSALGDYLEVGDEGKTLTVSSPGDGEIRSMMSVLVLTCVMDKLAAPDSVTSEVGQTTALMGRQDAEWDDITMEYSYHPDSGVSAVLTER